jgi:transposase
VLTFAAAMPVAKVAELTQEHDTRIWRVLEHHVPAARDREDFSAVTKVGMDETSARTGQDYVSIVADMVRGRVLFATEGRRSDTVAHFAADLVEHGGDPKKVTDTSSEMSTAFLRGIAEHLPNATMTFDRFHLAAKLSEAIDAVRRAEVTTRPELKRTRWLWLKNHANLSAKQQGELHRLMRPSAQLALYPSPALAPGLPSLLRPFPWASHHPVTQIACHGEKSVWTPARLQCRHLRSSTHCNHSHHATSRRTLDPHLTCSPARRFRIAHHPGS